MSMPSIPTIRTDRISSRSSSGGSSLLPGIQLIPVRRHSGRLPITLGPGRYTIGSGDSCHIVLTESGVASRHCTLVVGEFQNVIKAWSPLTWINEGVVSEGILRVGDHLIVGPVEFRIAQRESEPTSPLTAPVPPKLNSEALLSEALFGKAVNPSGEIRRKQQLEELLTAVQSALNDVIERERSVRDSLAHDRMVLSHRNEELSRQWEILNDTQARLTATVSQETENRKRHSDAERELAQFQRLLDERHAELARRATEQTRIHRLLKYRIQDFNEREKGLDAQLAVIENREHECRNLIARNTAQHRHLKTRTAELDLREEEIHRRLAGLADLGKQNEAQAAKFRQEQAQWSQNCEIRTNLLNDLEATLLHRAQAIEEKESELAILKDQLAEQKASLDAAISAYEGREKQSESVLGELRARELKLENELATLQSLREAFAKDQAELAESQARLEEAEAKLNEQLTRINSKENEVQAREQKLSQREAELQKGAARESQQHETYLLDVAELQKSLADLAAQKLELERERESVEIRQAEIDVEQQNLVRLRSEIAAERSRDDYDREQLQVRRQILDREQDDLSRTRKELDALSEQLNRERNELSFLKGSEQKGRQEESALTEQNAALKEQLSSVESENSRLEQELAQLRGKLAGTQQASDSLASQLEAQRVTLDERERALVALQVQLQQLQEEARYLNSGIADHLPALDDGFRAEPVDDSGEDRSAAGREETVDDDFPVSPLLRSLFKSDESSHEPEKEESQTLQLRSELASLFGLDSKTDTDADVGEPQEASPVDERLNATQEVAESPSVSPPSTGAVHSKCSQTEDDGELSIEQYMQRLLARNRSKSQDGIGAISEPIAPPVSSREEKPIELGKVAEEAAEEAPAPSRRARKMISGEKESIRADIHSFRELANYSARTAVAVSRVKRRLAQGHVMMGISAVGWVASAALLAGVFALNLPLLPEAAMTGGVSLLLTCLASVRMWEAKQMAALPALNLGKSASSDDEAVSHADSGESGNESR